ncbi:hypothetical protein [Tabrizicola soli]|uniref:Uncharacterized protein n=2 Tax=Tabrizicola soli TaxID=2185115 RepID=A0ABV7DSA6_9RHOB|nr:hypothetical protein [Tabrizicola soli]
MSELVLHPKTFLKSNALWPSGLLNVQARGNPATFGPNATAQVIPLMLRPKPGVQCLNKTGVPMPCWEIAPAGLGGYLGYYLPWQPNSTKTMVIGDKADFFITDTMNGCTFAAGIGGTVRVAHVNYNTFNADGDREEGLPIDQGHMDSEVQRVMGAATPGVALRKAGYTIANGDFPNVTVVGVRRAGLWTFAYQKRAMTAPARLGTAMVPGYRLVSVHNVH